MYNIGIIGAGKVGCSIALALKKEGYNIKGVYSRSNSSHQYLINMLKISVPNTINSVIENCNLIFITVSDSEIKNIGLLIDEQKKSLKGKVFFHCSGALTSDEIAILKKSGAYIGSFHPVQSFADKKEGWKSLYGIYYGFEGDKSCKKAAEEIVKVFKGNLIVINKENKVLYHAAACIISNYCVTLADIAGSIMKKIAVDGNVGEEALMPLLIKTADNIKNLGSVNALTGPISRGDASTVKEHLKDIKEKLPELENMYKVMGMSTVKVAKKKGKLDEDKITELINVLEK